MNTDKKNIVKSGFYSIIQIITATLSYAVIYILVVYNLGKDQLGIWSIMMTIPAALTFIGSGVSGCILRWLPIYHRENNYNKITQLIFNGLLINLLMGLVMILLGFFYAQQILSFLFSTTSIPQFYFLIFKISLTVFLINFMNSILLTSLDGLQLMGLKNKILIAASILVCIVAIVLIKLYQLKGLFYAQLIQSVSVTLLTVHLLIKTGLLKAKFAKLNFVTIKLFFEYGRTFQYISILTLLFDPITKYFLNRYFNLSIVGVFDIANRIVLQIRQLIVNAIQVIIPVVTKQNEENRLDTHNLYAKASRGALLISIISYGLLISSIFALAGFVMEFEQVHFQVMIVLLVIAQLFNIISAPGYAILIGLGKLKPLLYSHLLATGLNLGLFIVLQYFTNDYTIVLPTFLAITLSSIYITYYFRKKHISMGITIPKEDKLLYLSSLIFPCICFMGRIYNSSNYLLIMFLIIQMITLLFLIFRNNFIKELMAILFKRLPAAYGT